MTTPEVPTSGPSATKLLRGLQRRSAWLADDAVGLSYRRLSPVGREQGALLEQFRGAHQGGRCAIVGNGPSLKETDLALLSDVPSFGTNRIYLMSEALGLSPSYYVCINDLVISQIHEDIAALMIPRFLRLSSKELFDDVDSPMAFLRTRRRPAFATDVTTGIWEGSTVTFVAMQLAFFMGFSDVVLVGVDHNFTTKGKPHETVVSTGDDPNHFDPKYFGAGFRWQLPDLEGSEVAYRAARDVFESEGRRITDATVGGKLRVFQRIDLKDWV